MLASRVNFDGFRFSGGAVEIEDQGLDMELLTAKQKT
jgi:hypothetical protein